MTEKDEKNEPQIAVTAEPVAAGGGGGKTGGPPIPPGHSRYYCSKCHAVSIYVFVQTINIMTSVKHLLVFFWLARGQGHGGGKECCWEDRIPLISFGKRVFSRDVAAVSYAAFYI